MPFLSYVAGAFDDPHFKTWNGRFFDFQGACDLILIHAPNFAAKAGLALDINIRTKIRYAYSYIQNAVVKIGDETFEVASFGEYFLNGVSSAQMPGTIAGFQVNHTLASKKVHVFEIQVSADEKIVLKTFKDMVSVKIVDANADRFQGSQGMMGEFGTGKMLGRDGKTIVEDPVDFAAEWQVHKDEPLLFQTVQAPQHPQECMLPLPKKESRRLGESIAREAAKEACAKWDKAMKEACIYDVMATGDLDLATAGAF